MKLPKIKTEVKLIELNIKVDSVLKNQKISLESRDFLQYLKNKLSIIIIDNWYNILDDKKNTPISKEQNDFYFKIKTALFNLDSYKESVFSDDWYFSKDIPLIWDYCEWNFSVKMSWYWHELNCIKWISQVKYFINDLEVSFDDYLLYSYKNTLEAYKDIIK